MMIPLLKIVFLLCCATNLLQAFFVDLKSLIHESVTFRADGMIAIPPQIKHIKFDIGLSYAAPISQYWLTHEDDLLVFGFEPNPASVASIMQGAVKRDARHGEPLEKRFIGDKFFLIPCALGLSNNNMITFFVTANDCGCSSMYTPKKLLIERIIEVPIFSLAAFFDLFPFDTHPIIEYIKIDAQGADLDIVKSGGHYIEDHVIFITLEAENEHYSDTINSHQDIENYMRNIGFLPYHSPHTEDPTYVNSRYVEYLKTHPVHIYQKG